MSFSVDDIAGMLDEYLGEHKDISFDTHAVGKAIYYYTSGYPFLVSSMCRVIDMAVRGISPYSEPILSQLVFSFLKNKKTGMRTVNCAGKTIVETVV